MTPWMTEKWVRHAVAHFNGTADARRALTAAEFLQVPEASLPDPVEEGGTVAWVNDIEDGVVAISDGTVWTRIDTGEEI